jgi:RHS repeat-associated protein
MANIDDSNDSEFLCFTYDGFGNLVSSSEIYPDMYYDINYGYDSRGLLKTIQYPDDKIITYQRDALGRVETVSYDGQTIAQYYYLGGKVIKKTIGGIEYTANIDSLGRIESEGYGGLTFDYGYLTHTDRLTARNTVDYGYDTLGRVDSEESTSYYCDLLGNPTNAGNDGLTYTMDNEDRITEVADGSTAVAYYSYDRTGRRISKTVDEVKTYFAYDKFGNVIAEYIRDGNETVWQKDYVYGANGELIYMQLPGIPASSSGEDLDDFIDFCNSWLCAPYCDSNDLVWDYDNNNNINFIDWAYHSADMNDVVITPYQINGKYILTDFHNSVVGISDGSSIVEIAYNAWGVPSYTGDLDGLNILWNGYYSDEETGNYYLRNRYYSPLERKFVTQDPRGINPDGNWNNPLDVLSQSKDGVALDVYCQSDPVNGRDDWGLACGSGWTDFVIPDFMIADAIKFDFTSACEWHDKCYGCNPEKRFKNTTKSQCDKSFMFRMKVSCYRAFAENSYWWNFHRDNEQLGKCLIFAKTYAAAVEKGGGKYFAAARKNTCCVKK